MRDHRCIEYFEGTGKTEFCALECFINFGFCTVCGRALREEFNYSHTYDNDTDECLD